VTGYATPCAWSPDGTRIAFQSDRDASTAPDLYVMNADGTGVVRLTSRPGYESECSWSPDGSTLVFAWGDNRGRSEIYTIRADGTDERELTNGGLLTPPIGSRDPAWSPDGAKIAFNASRQYFGVNDGGIYVMNADGSHQVRLSGSQTYATDNPTWSPDGTMIAYAAYADTSTDMFVVNADGSGERRLARLPGYEFFPAW